jgi:hypothetical protein
VAGGQQHTLRPWSSPRKHLIAVQLVSSSAGEHAIPMLSACLVPSTAAVQLAHDGAAS